MRPKQQHDPILDDVVFTGIVILLEGMGGRCHNMVVCLEEPCLEEACLAEASLEACLFKAPTFDVM